MFEFSGFVWDDEEAKERGKLQDRLSKVNGQTLSSLCFTFDLSREGKKEDKVARLAEFFEAPKALGVKDLAEAEVRDMRGRECMGEGGQSLTTW